MTDPELLLTDWQSLLVPQRRASRIAASLNRQGIEKRPRGSSKRSTTRPEKTVKMDAGNV